MSTIDSDSIPLDGEAALTPDERRALRRIIRDDERASWAWKRLKIITPMVVASMVAIWQLVDWVIRHVRVTP